MTQEQTQTVNLAIGRIFRMASRPEQAGDGAEYQRCRSIILDLLDPTGNAYPDMRPCWVRDRNKGAQGD